MDLIWIVPAGALIALLFAVYNAVKVERADRGSDKVKALSDIIKQGANAYLKRQYKTVAIFFAVVFAVLLILSLIAIINAETALFAHKTRRDPRGTYKRIHAVCIPYGRRFLRTVRLFRYENSDVRKRQNGYGGAEQPQ